MVDLNREASLAVIVHWGDSTPTARLAAQVAPAFQEVLVVANDGSARPPSLPAATGWISSSNIGYAGACALGTAQRPDYDFYAFLNNDLEITACASSALLAVLAKHPKLAVVGPSLFHSDGQLQSGAGTWSPVLCAPRVQNLATTLQSCHWITGAAMFCRGEVVRTIGLDHAYFLGQEDADFCDRVAKSGWDVAIAGHISATHEGRTTISAERWQYYSIRNRLWFIRRRRAWARFALVFVWTALVLAPRILAADILKRRGLLLTRLACHAVVDGIRPMPSPDRFLADEPRPSRWMTW